MLIAREDFRTRPVRVHTSASAFTFPPHTLRRHAHEDFGLPQQQLSTMGYPRKSYPHRCSPPCAKRSRPRACARVYIIIVRPSAAPGECSRRCGEEVAPLWSRGPRRRAQGGGGRRQRRTPPCAATRTLPAYHPLLPACVPNHCAQRRKCTRQSPLLPTYRPAPAA